MLAYYHRYRLKIDLYRKNINYESSYWITYTAHHKPTNKDEDHWGIDKCGWYQSICGACVAEVSA